MVSSLQRVTALSEGWQLFDDVLQSSKILSTSLAWLLAFRLLCRFFCLTVALLNIVPVEGFICGAICLFLLYLQSSSRRGGPDKIRQMLNPRSSTQHLLIHFVRPCHNFYVQKKSAKFGLIFDPGGLGEPWSRKGATYSKSKISLRASMIHVILCFLRIRYSLVRWTRRTTGSLGAAWTKTDRRNRFLVLLKFGVLVYHGSPEPASLLQPRMTGRTGDLKWQYSAIWHIFQLSKVCGWFITYASHDVQISWHFCWRRKSCL